MSILRDLKGMFDFSQADMNPVPMIQEWAEDAKNMVDFSQMDLDFSRMFKR